jgi:tRNA splicing endonuclease
MGDPELQHAVACVRIVHPDRQPCPIVLAGAARTAFGARKDLLLACVDHDLQAVHYMTLTPEAKEQA